MSITGLGDWLKHREEQPQTGDYIPELRLKGRESARIRFLTDGDEIEIREFHGVPGGSRGYNRDVYCLKEDGKDCELCEKGIKRSAKWHVWVYVYYKLCVEPGEGRVVDQVGNNVFFRQEINKVMLLRMGMGKDCSRINQLITPYQRLGTLVDRDYDFIRSGKGKDDTSYNLFLDAPSEFTAEVDMPEYTLAEVAQNYPFEPKKGKTSATPPVKVENYTISGKENVAKVLSDETVAPERPDGTRKLFSKLFDVD